MGLHYGIPQPMRLYENKAHRNKFIPGGENRVFKLLCPLDRLLPFQIKRNSGFYPITSLKLMDDTTDLEVLDLLPFMDSNDFDVFIFDAYDYILHYGYLEHTATIEPGRYYLEISDSVTTWWSDTLTFLDFDSETLGSCVPTRIEFKDTCDVGEMFYRSKEFGGKTFRFLFYLDVDIGRPVHVTREEGTENAFGESSTDFAVSEKQHLLQALLPQYMLDVLALIPLHFVSGEVKVATWRGYEKQVLKFTMDPKWQGDKAAFALTDLVIVTDIITKSGCCDGADVPSRQCVRPATEVLSLMVSGSGNYDLFEYTDSETGLQVSLEDGDRVLIDYGSGNLRYATCDVTGALYDHIGSFSNGDALIDLNQLKAAAPTDPINYFFNSQTGRFAYAPVIKSILNPTGPFTFGDKVIKGYAWKRSIIEVWEVIAGEHVRQLTGSGEDFIGAGLQYAHDENATMTYVKTLGLNCVLGLSKPLYWAQDPPESELPEGIGEMGIGSSFIVSGFVVDNLDE